MNYKVSIIIPVYNVEKYLSSCIESVQKQTLEDIEIILINDGSTDNSLSICEQYQLSDERIKVFDKPNGGVSSARNAGLKIAKGEFIGFVDPDDWIESNMYENLLRRAEVTNTTVCISSYVIETSKRTIPKLLNFDKEVLGNIDVNNLIVARMIGDSGLDSSNKIPEDSKEIMGSVWRLLIKRDFIDEHNFRFQLGVPIMEDLIFCIEILSKCENLSIDNNAYYHYRTNENSITLSYVKDFFELSLEVFNKIDEILKDGDFYYNFEKRINSRYVNIFIATIINETNKGNYKKTSKKVDFISEICKDSNLKKIINNHDTNGYSVSKKITLMAIKYELGIYLFTHYYILKRLI